MKVQARMKVNEFAVALRRAEKLCIVIIFATAVLAVLFISMYSLSVDYLSFILPCVFSFLLLLIGFFYRSSGRSDRIGDTLLACGLLVLFTNFGAVLNYTLLGRGMPVIDAHLFAADAWLGFKWKPFVEGMANYPRFSQLLAEIYKSSLPQLVVAVLILGFLGLGKRLHHFLLVGIFSSLACIGVWAFFPSFGPSPYIPISAAFDARIGRVVDADMGQALLQLHRDGPGVIQFDQMLGLIAFPSMHTVMALMCTWHLRGTWAFWPMVGVNVLMIPAILVHGGHHLVDMIAGVVTFVAASILATTLLSEDDLPIQRLSGP